MLECEKGGGVGEEGKGGEEKEKNGEITAEEHAGRVVDSMTIRTYSMNSHPKLQAGRLWRTKRHR